MDITDEDVRIKETDISDKRKPTNSQKVESSNVEKFHRSKDTNVEKSHSSSTYKRKNFSRSQSVSTPKTAVPKAETNLSYKCMSKLSSLSNMSDKDLEDWKQILVELKPSSSPSANSEEPILTVASSLTSSPSVTIGFNVHEEKKE